MSYTYAQRKRTADAGVHPLLQTGDAAQRMEALQSGAVKPSAAEMGHRVDLPEAMRARMESSFGADLSAVRLYESQTVADAGAEAITRGNTIAFAPGKLDFSSHGGQALLGHELSHVVSQARGEVTGAGFLNDRALEARADREGAMAAAGESVYGGAVAPLSSATAAPATGPMQAMKKKDQAELDQLEEKREALNGSDKFDRKTWKRYNHLRHKAVDENYRDAKWGSAKRRANKASLTRTTGLSDKRADIEARMLAEMQGITPTADPDEEDDF